MDEQTSGDIGTGGIMTHSMLLAIDKLQKAGEDQYSVGLLHNATVDQDNKVFNSAQDITIMTTESVAPNEMAWPLLPLQDYQAPLTKAGKAKLDPQVLQQLGVPAHIAGFVDESGLADGIDPDELMV